MLLYKNYYELLRLFANEALEISAKLIPEYLTFDVKMRAVEA